MGLGLKVIVNTGLSTAKVDTSGLGATGREEFGAMGSGVRKNR